jgi:hypothetical protein
VKTLYILRSKPDGQVRELMRAVTSGESTEITLYEEVVDYDRLIRELFRHDQVVCWW